ncbi:TMhelix containing protein [Vibrio phage 1.104.O._10N.286.49.A12]|nr:TMhelix containing protein [Vibrio phage 1.104.O._10N.286.49.A12]
MTYNPFKYWYHRTKYYMKQPLTWVLDVAIIGVFAAALLYEGEMDSNSIAILLVFLYLIWKLFRGFLRFLVSLFVCTVAAHHFGFNQEYYDCINGR